jgi:hypothetical protein
MPQAVYQTVGVADESTLRPLLQERDDGGLVTGLPPTVIMVVMVVVVVLIEVSLVVVREAVFLPMVNPLM